MNIARSPFALGGVLATALAPLAAQDTTSTAAPAPHVVIETVGPDGWRLRYGPTNLGGLLALPSELWDLVLSGALQRSGPPSAEPDAEQREQARALLREHNLGTLRTATGYADATWRWRVFW